MDMAVQRMNEGSKTNDDDKSSVSVTSINKPQEDQKSRHQMKTIPDKERSRIEQARQIISARQIQKLAKEDHPIFLAIVRTNELSNKQRKRSQNRAAKFAAAHGITEGQKRQINKQTGPKKDFTTVEEREQQVLDAVPQRHRKDLKSIIDAHKDVFPEKLPKGAPPLREVQTRHRRGAKQ